jgi:hypothetical protein
MGIVPRQLVDKVVFFESRLEAFEAHAQQIGTTTQAVAELRAAVEAARAAQLAQLQAQAAARSATLAFNEAVAAVAARGAAIIGQVRATARSIGSDAVYLLAQVPPVADRSPTPAPGEPTNFAFSLEGNGQLTLTWDCRNPRGSGGTVYQVYRRVGPDGPMEFLGVAGRRKRFIDVTIPAGATMLTYGVRAVRSTKAGRLVTHAVNFGTNGATPLPDMRFRDGPTLQVA